MGKQALLQTLTILMIGVIWHEIRWSDSIRQKALLVAGGRGFPRTFSTTTELEKNILFLENWIFGKREEFPPFLYLVATLSFCLVVLNLNVGNNFFLSLLPLIGVVYFFLPWLPWGSWWSWLFKGTMMHFWITITSGLYLMGIFSHLQKWRDGADFFFSFAGIGAVIVLRYLMPKIQTEVERRWPSFAGKIYGKSENHFLAGFLLTLILSALLLVVSLEPIAKQTVLIAYYMLFVGIVLEAKALLEESSNKQTNKYESLDKI